MWEHDAGRKARMIRNKGARLIRAFLRITDPRVRLAIVQMVEKVGSAAAADC
jgi:hypothetical protein